MKIVRLLGLVFNVLLFLFLVFYLLMNYHQISENFNLSRLFNISIVLLMVSTVLPFVFLREVSSEIFTKGKNIGFDPDILDITESTFQLAEELTESASNRWRFWVAISGIIQVVMSLLLFSSFREFFDISSFGIGSVVITTPIISIFISGLISIFYLKR